MGVFGMTKHYHLEPGYVTIPEANKIVLRILRIVDINEKSHYTKILTAAKKGLYGGKKYGSRMYQVRRQDIIQYAERHLQTEQLELFNIDLATNLVEVEMKSKLPSIDTNTAKKMHYYLKYLKFHEIISDEAFQNAEKQLIIRLKMKEISKA